MLNDFRIELSLEKCGDIGSSQILPLQLINKIVAKALTDSLEPLLLKCKAKPLQRGESKSHNDAREINEVHKQIEEIPEGGYAVHVNYFFFF